MMFYFQNDVDDPRVYLRKYYPLGQRMFFQIHIYYNKHCIKITDICISSEPKY